MGWPIGEMVEVEEKTNRGLIYKKAKLLSISQEGGSDGSFWEIQNVALVVDEKGYIDRFPLHSIRFCDIGGKNE